MPKKTPNNTKLLVNLLAVFKNAVISMLLHFALWVRFPLSAPNTRKPVIR